MTTMTTTNNNNYIDDRVDIAEMFLVAMEKLYQWDEALQESIHDLQEDMNTKSDVDEKEKAINHQPLAVEIWEALVPRNFKQPMLGSFHGGSPQEHIVTKNTHMDIIRVDESLKCNFMSRTFKEAELK